MEIIFVYQLKGSYAPLINSKNRLYKRDDLKKVQMPKHGAY
jgi:hypothetical protein